VGGPPNSTRGGQPAGDRPPPASGCITESQPGAPGNTHSHGATFSPLASSLPTMAMHRAPAKLPRYGGGTPWVCHWSHTSPRYS